MRGLATVLCGVIGLSFAGCMDEHHGHMGHEGHGMKHEKGEGEEANEVKVAFAETPAAVQATLIKESGGAKIATVDKEMDKGKTIYEADVMMSGKNYEIKVAEDGMLIAKKIDMEDEKMMGKEGGKKEEEDEKEKK